MRTKLFLAALALSASAMAQVIDYHYCEPKEANLITARKGEAKIHREANKKSPVLWHGCVDETDDCAYMWSDNKLPDYEAQPYTIVHDTDVLLSIEGEGDFHKVSIGNANENLVGYMNRKEMEPAKVEEVTLDDLRARPSEFIVIEEGPCKGLVIRTWSDEVWGEADLMLGNLHNGMLVFSHHVFGQMLYDSEQKRFEIGSEGDLMQVHFGPKQARDCGDGFYVLDPQKITRTHLETFLILLNAQREPDYLEVMTKKNGELITTYSSPILDPTPLVYKNQKLNETTHVGFKE